MFEFTETIDIQTPAANVWDTIVEVERWWPPSNPEHESLERLDEGDLKVGTRFRIREKVAGIPGEAIGIVTDLEPGTRVTWRADQARYRLLGISITLGEGVTWRVERDGPDACRLSAHVWATFPHGVTGRVLSFVFTQMLDGIAKDRQHTRTELEYLKKLIESTAD